MMNVLFCHKLGVASEKDLHCARRGLDKKIVAIPPRRSECKKRLFTSRVTGLLSLHMEFLHSINCSEKVHGTCAQF